jgi:hypothetical protein
LLTQHGIAISMDGVGRAFDNIRVERLWRTVKYEDVYIRDYQNPTEARGGAWDAILRFVMNAAGIGRWAARRRRRCMVLQKAVMLIR